MTTLLDRIESAMVTARDEPGFLSKAEPMLAAGLRDLVHHVAALQARVAELEKQPFAYDGPHEQGKVYDKGMFVTHDGSLWHCNYKTGSRPGDGPAWTLAVKRGRDGR